MKTSAFIISNNELIATCTTQLKSGALVQYAYSRTKEAINADREFNLVNSRDAVISRAEKWQKKAYEADHATEINEAEFYVF